MLATAELRSIARTRPSTCWRSAWS